MNMIKSLALLLALPAGIAAQDSNCANPNSAYVLHELSREDGQSGPVPANCENGYYGELPPPPPPPPPMIPEPVLKTDPEYNAAGESLPQPTTGAEAGLSEKEVEELPRLVGDAAPVHPQWRLPDDGDGSYYDPFECDACYGDADRAYDSDAAVCEEEYEEESHEYYTCMDAADDAWDDATADCDSQSFCWEE